MPDVSNIALNFSCVALGVVLGVVFELCYSIILARAIQRLFNNLREASAGFRSRVLNIAAWVGILVPPCSAYLMLQSSRLFGVAAEFVGVGVGLGVAAPWLLSFFRTMTRGQNTPDSRDSKALTSPPVAAQYLLELLAPAEWSEAVLGDFFELYERRFQRVENRYGVFLAKVHYWSMVLRTAPGLLRIRSRHLAALVGIIKVLDVLQKYWVAK